MRQTHRDARSAFRNILAGYLRYRQLGIGDAQRAYDGAARLLRGNERMPTAQSVLNLVETSNLAASDCEFVAVANALQIPLATADRKILKNFQQTAHSLEELLR